MKDAKTPTVAIARALRALGLKQGDDFRVTGHYQKRHGYSERIGTYVIVLSRRADDVIAEHADEIEATTGEVGYSFRVSLYYRSSGRVFTTIRNFGDRVREAAPVVEQAAEQPAEAAPAVTGDERAADLAHLIGRSFTRQRTDYQVQGWPIIERTATVLEVVPDYMPTLMRSVNVGVRFRLTDMHRPDGIEQSLTLAEFRKRWMDDSSA